MFPAKFPAYVSSAYNKQTSKIPPFSEEKYNIMEENHTAEEDNTTQFRVKNKSFHLTYKHHLNHESILNFFSGKGTIHIYSIVHENGTADDDFPYEHTHVLISFTKSFESRNSRCFDITHDGLAVHPNIKVVTTNKHATTIYFVYHHKNPVRIWQSENTPPKPASAVEKIIKQADSIFTAGEQLGIVPKSYSDLQILWNAKRRRTDHNHKYPNTVWTLQHPHPIKVLYVWGPTNFGKTQWALAAFKYPLLVRHIEDLRDFDADRNDGIVFDDITFAHRPATEVIHMLDWDEASSIHARYANIILPAETPKIFCNNLPPDRCFPASDPETWAAIRRRIHKVIHIAAKTYQEVAPIVEELPASQDFLNVFDDTPN
jgi:hypothetical protein